MDQKPSLWISYFMVVLGSAFSFGWNISVTNQPEPFIRCWIQESRNESQFNDRLDCGQSKFGLSPDLSDRNITDLEELKSIMDKSTGLWALSTSIFAIGGMLGSLLATPIAQKLGNKKTLIFNAVLLSGSCVLLGFTKQINKYSIYIIGRTLTGISCGVSSSVGPVYLSSISPPEHKGFFGTSFQIGLCIAGMI